MSKSYQPPDRSTYDPGWNDPPPMTTGQSTPSNKSRLSLNKRVAFPMQNATPPSTSNVKTAESGLPLPFSTAKYNPVSSTSTSPLITTATLPPSLPPLPTQSAGSKVASTTPAALIADVDLLEVPSDAKEICHRIFMLALASSPDSLETVKQNEIEKRLEILFTTWTNGQLNKDAERYVYGIAKALEHKNISAAMEQHRLLAFNQTTVCSQWGTALRHLILINEPVESRAAHDYVETPAFLDVNPKQTDPIPDSTDSVEHSSIQRSGTSRFGQIQHL